MKRTEWTIKGSPQTEGENQAKAPDWKTDGVKPTVVLPCNVIKDSLMPSHQSPGTVFTGNLMRTEKESAIQTSINKGITGLNIEDSPPSEDRRVVREKQQDEENISTPTSFSPSLNCMGMWARSISNTSPTSVMQPTVPLSSSCSPVLCLSPPLPPCMELSAVLSNRTLTLDLYKGGTALLPILWDSIAGELRRLQYLRLGSEDQAAMQGAVEVLPHLTQLRSLAIRGNVCYDSRGNPLPGLLTTLPDSISSLSLLVHLDLSFNQLSNVPPCLLTLPRLSILILCYNQLLTLPPCFGHLASLSYLSLLGNQLESLPSSLGQLKVLRTLDLSYNQLHSLPDEIGALNGLVKLELSQNKLRGLPDTMGSLTSLRDLSIQGNELRQLPQCLSTLPMLKIDVRNNPLGRPPAPPPLPPQPKQVEASVSELHLGFRQQSFSVSSAGCHVFLPGGAELLFPPGCLVTTTRLHWIERWPNKQLVWLEEHDFLLSRPLELSPHGIQFLKPVEVCVPYHRIRRREVVVRRFDGQSWSTLPTVLRRGSPSHSSRPGGQPARVHKGNQSI